MFPLNAMAKIIRKKGAAGKILGKGAPHGLAGRIAMALKRRKGKEPEAEPVAQPVVSVYSDEKDARKKKKLGATSAMTGGL